MPRETITENDKPLDVIVHIHGGAYMLGSPAMMGGPDYIMDKDVVYVTFTYRLGVLGKTYLLKHLNCYRLIILSK